MREEKWRRDPRPASHRAAPHHAAARVPRADADRRHWWLLLPALLPLATPLYNRDGPHLFTRDIYRVYLRPDATPAEETRVSKIASLTVKVGALLVIALLNPQFAIDLQLIGGVVILQTLPALAIGLRSVWPHRWALASGLVTGFAVGMVMLYQVPQLGGAGGTTVVRAHFGGSAWPLSHLGIDTDSSIYVGIVALAVNLVVTGLVTVALRLLKVPDGPDGTRPDHYVADEGDSRVGHMTNLLDGEYGRAARGAGQPAPAVVRTG